MKKITLGSPDSETNIQAEGQVVPTEEFKEILNSAPKVDLTTENPVAEPIKPLSLIYCGPNLPRGILNQFTIYRDGLPSHLDGHLDKCAAIKRLFVSVESLSETLRSTQQAGTPEQIWFGEIQDYIQGGAKK
jgi:hypothetical protein